MQPIDPQPEPATGAAPPSSAHLPAPAQPSAPANPRFFSARRIGLLATIVLALVVLAILYRPFAGSRRDVTIGVEGRKLVEIPGPRLQAVPFTPGDAVSLRIESFDATPGGFRYDLRYVAYGPGKHDLSQALMTPSGRPLAARDDLAIEVATLLPTDHEGELFATEPSEIRLVSNYYAMMAGLWIGWALLLLPLILIGRTRRAKVVRPPPTPSVAARLCAMLERAAVQSLTAPQQADLEQLLLAFWSQRLNLSNRRLTDTIAELKSHPVAGRHWIRVERWLHSPHATSDAVAAELLHDLKTLKGGPASNPLSSLARRPHP